MRILTVLLTPLVATYLGVRWLVGRIPDAVRGLGQLLGRFVDGVVAVLRGVWRGLVSLAAATRRGIAAIGRFMGRVVAAAWRVIEPVVQAIGHAIAIAARATWAFLARAWARVVVLAKAVGHGIAALLRPIGHAINVAARATWAFLARAWARLVVLAKAVGHGIAAALRAIGHAINVAARATWAFLARAWARVVVLAKAVGHGIAAALRAIGHAIAIPVGAAARAAHVGFVVAGKMLSRLTAAAITAVARALDLLGSALERVASGVVRLADLAIVASGHAWRWLRPRVLAIVEVVQWIIVGCLRASRRIVVAVAGAIVAVARGIAAAGRAAGRIVTRVWRRWVAPVLGAAWRAASTTAIAVVAVTVVAPGRLILAAARAAGSRIRRAARAISLAARAAGRSTLAAARRAGSAIRARMAIVRQAGRDVAASIRASMTAARRAILRALGRDVEEVGSPADTPSRAPDERAPTPGRLARAVAPATLPDASLAMLDDVTRAVASSPTPATRTRRRGRRGSHRAVGGSGGRATGVTEPPRSRELPRRAGTPHRAMHLRFGRRRPAAARVPPRRPAS